MNTGMVIAIDGNAGAGKSTTAKEVAKRLGFLYIDTGAMYRAVTLGVIRKLHPSSPTEGGLLRSVSGEDIGPAEEDKIKEIVDGLDIQLKLIGSEPHTFLNGEDVTDKIRSPEIGEFVSRISTLKGVREKLVKMQRKFRESYDIVMEGRDIGSYVFPDADFKFYLVASLEERAKRRLKDYMKLGKSRQIGIDEIKKELESRDYIDSTRKYSPLKRARGAVVIDTTDISLDEQVQKIIDYVKGSSESKVH